MAEGSEAVLPGEEGVNSDCCSSRIVELLRRWGHHKEVVLGCGIVCHQLLRHPCRIKLPMETQLTDGAKLPRTVWFIASSCRAGKRCFFFLKIF